MLAMPEPMLVLVMEEGLAEPAATEAAQQLRIMAAPAATAVFRVVAVVAVEQRKTTTPPKLAATVAPDPEAKLGCLL